MPRRPISVTLDQANLLWLRGRARVSSGGNVSEALDRLISEARAGRGARVPARSVVGTVDLPDDDADLARADEAVRALFAASRPLPGPARAASPGAKRRRG